MMRLPKQLKLIAHAFYAFLILFSAFFFYPTAARAQSANDGFDPQLAGFQANGVVFKTLVQPDGKILIGGGFTSVLGQPRNYIARVNPDGTLDTAFNPNANCDAYEMVLQSDGKILVGGCFTTIGGQTRNYFARLDPVTGAADAFNPSPNNSVGEIVIQPDGKILIGGNNFTKIGTVTRNRIARLNADGTLDTGFNPNASSSVRTIVLQPDGKILVGGLFTSIGGLTRNRIARLNPTTGAPDSFNPDAQDQVNDIAVLPDGKILVGGYFVTIGGTARNGLARVTSTGALDTTFTANTNPTGGVSKIVLQPDGKILVTGTLSSINGQLRSRIARLDPTTGAPDSLNPNPDNLINNIALQSDGKILICGNFESFGGPIFRNRLARLERDGSVEQTVNPAAAGTDTAVTVAQPDGKIIIAGSFTNILGTARNNIARLNPDGTLDTTFNPNAMGTVKSVVLQEDGKILIGGDFTSVGGQTRNYLARLDKTTGAPDSFDANANGAVSAILVQPDNKKIIIAGAFTAVKGQTRRGLARVDPTNGAPDSWNPNVGGNSFAPELQGCCSSLASWDQGKSTTVELVRLLIVGGFNSVGGQPRSGVAMVDLTTGAPTSFNPNVNGPVNVVAVNNNKIIIGGTFTQVNGVPRTNMARLTWVDPGNSADSDNLAVADAGTLDDFAPNPNGAVSSIAVQSDGKVLIGGNFTSIGGQARNYFARLTDATGAADSFDVNASATVSSISLQPDGKILAGGNFNSIGGQARNLVARLTNDTAAISNMIVTPNTLTLTRSGSAPQFARVVFEQSTDNGATWTALGEATNGFAPQAETQNAENPFAPQAPQVVPAYTLSGQNIPIQQNVLIRATGFYRGGLQSGSETSEDKTQNVFLSPRTATLSIDGAVNYALDATKKVGGVSLTASAPTTGDPSVSTGSAAGTGAYTLSSLFTYGQYDVSLSKTGQANGVTSFDATLILRHVAAGGQGPNALNANQQLAADVNQSGSITPFDATLILRFVAAGGSTANTGQVGKWKFNPAQRSYNLNTSSLSGENFDAVLLGDINNSWDPNGAIPSETEKIDKGQKIEVNSAKAQRPFINQE